MKNTSDTKSLKRTELDVELQALAKAKLEALMTEAKALAKYLGNAEEPEVEVEAVLVLSTEQSYEDSAVCADIVTSSNGSHISLVTAGLHKLDRLLANVIVGNCSEERQEKDKIELAEVFNQMEQRSYFRTLKACIALHEMFNESKAKALAEKNGTH